MSLSIVPKMSDSFSRMGKIALSAALISTSIAVGFGVESSTAHAGELNIYSYRSPILLEPFLTKYTAKTGTRFNVVHAPKGLVTRLKSEGSATKADLVLTVDVSRVEELADTGLLDRLNSPVINKNVPAHLRDVSDTWTALSLRARIVVASDAVKNGEINRIEDLVNPKWKGRICTRKGSHVYNRALLASLIAHHGEEKAEAWAQSLVSNLARKPQGNDRAQAKAIWAGECDVAIMNSYYFGKMKFNNKQPEQQDWAKALTLIFLNQDDRGQHVNISAGGIVKTSDNKEEAMAFLEWLTSDEAQQIYASVNYEYPVNPAVPADNEVASWGQFKVDQLPISTIAKLSPAAQIIIDRTGW